MSRIKPYKYVNPNLITGMKAGKKMDGEKGGATIIAAGKKITGPAVEGLGAVKMGRVTLLGLNRIGSTVEAIGNANAAFYKTLITEKKFLTTDAEIKKRRLGRARDQANEDRMESGTSKPITESLNKEVKKKEKKLTWLDKVLGPFKGIIEFAVRTMVTQGLLHWLADPKNAEGIGVFIKNLQTVFGFVYNIAYKSIDFFLTGVANIFGTGDKKGFSRFQQVMTGLGQVLIGLAGLKALSYLNPFKLVGDLMGLMDFFNKPKPDLATTGGTPPTPDAGKPKPSADVTPPVKPKANKPKGILDKGGDLLNQWKKTVGSRLGDAKSGILKGWDNIKMLGGSITKGMRDQLAASGKWIQEGVSKKLTPIAKGAYNLLEKKGIISMAKKAGNAAKGAITKIPGYDKVAKKVASEGGAAMLGKLGGKAIPIIGGLVNLYFAYDRFKNGDKSGAALEALSGILDLSGLFGFVPGPMISMALDAYLFGRDFFPDVVKGENEFLDKILGGVMGPLKSIQDSLPKIPQLAAGGIVNKPTIAMLGENGPEAVVPLTGGNGQDQQIAKTLLSSIYGSMDRMGPGGEVARQLMAGELSSIKTNMGIGAVTSTGGGDSISKSVQKATTLRDKLLKDPTETLVGDKNPVIGKASNDPSTLRGQLANVLATFMTLSGMKLTSDSGGGVPGGPGGGSGGVDSDGGGDVDTSGVEAASGSVVDKGVAIAKKLMSNLSTTKEAAAAIAGNFAHESGGFVPGIREGGPFAKSSKPWPKGTIRKGYGWAQWTNSAPGDRYDKFIESYGGDYNKIPTNEDNLKFAVQEMRGPEKLSDNFKKMTDTAKAAVWFRKNWERAGVHHDGPRIAYAKGILAKMAKGGKLWENLHGIDRSKPLEKPSTGPKPAPSAPDKAPGKFAVGGKYGNHQNGKLPASDLASIRGGGKLRSDVAPNFNKMWDDAKAAGHSLRLNSSYRSYEDQVATYARYGSPRAAKPGSSPHSWGLAADLGFSNDGYKWLKKNAAKYGLNQIPGLETNNPDGYEAWHWQFGSGRPGGSIPKVDGTSPSADSTSGGNSGGGGGSTAAAPVDPAAGMAEAFDKLNSMLYGTPMPEKPPAATPAKPSGGTGTATSPTSPPGALAPGQRPDKALTKEQFAIAQKARASAKAAGMSGMALERYVANAVMGVPQSTPQPTISAPSSAGSSSVSSSSLSNQVNQGIENAQSASGSVIVPMPINSPAMVSIGSSANMQVFRPPAPLTRGFGG